MIHKTESFTLLIVCLCTIIGSNAQTQQTMENEKTVQEQKEVLHAIEKMTKAFHNKDIEGVMSSYEPGAVVVFEPKKPVSGETVLRTMFQGAFMSNPKFTYKGHEVFINGTIATHFAPWYMVGKTPDGTVIKQQGLSVAVLRKQSNGAWLLIFDNPHGDFLMHNQD